jgi:hypothetical protein
MTTVFAPCPDGVERCSTPTQDRGNRVACSLRFASLADGCPVPATLPVLFSVHERTPFGRLENPRPDF